MNATPRSVKSPLGGAFWRLFSASTASNLGDGMVAAAAPLLALTLTNDPRMLSAVSFASMLPWLVLTLPAGVFIDRHQRRTIMATANFARAALFALLAALALSNQINIWLLLLVVLCLAVAEVMFDMSSQAFLPAIVDPDQLERANGRLYAAEVAANWFVGLPWAFPQVWSVLVAGVLMAVFGTVWNVLTVSLRQRLIPADLFGRVNSVYRFLGTGTSAIGALIGGQIAFHFGLRATYLASAVTLGVVLLFGAPRLLRNARIYMAPERTPAPPSIT